MIINARILYENLLFVGEIFLNVFFYHVKPGNKNTVQALKYPSADEVTIYARFQGN